MRLCEGAAATADDDDEASVAAVVAAAVAAVSFAAYSSCSATCLLNSANMLRIEVIHAAVVVVAATDGDTDDDNDELALPRMGSSPAMHAAAAAAHGCGRGCWCTSATCLPPTLLLPLLLPPLLPHYFSLLSVVFGSRSIASPQSLRDICCTRDRQSSEQAGTHQSTTHNNVNILTITESTHTQTHTHRGGHQSTSQRHVMCFCILQPRSRYQPHKRREGGQCEWVCFVSRAHEIES